MSSSNPQSEWVSFDDAYPPPYTNVLAFGAKTAIFDVVQFKPDITAKPLTNNYGYHYAGNNMPTHWKFVYSPHYPGE